jgi:hypothetical protein
MVSLNVGVSFRAMTEVTNENKTIETGQSTGFGTHRKNRPKVQVQSNSDYFDLSAMRRNIISFHKTELK